MNTDRVPSNDIVGVDGLVFDGSLRTTHSHDADAQASLLRGWNQSYAQISTGKFSGSVIELQFSDVSLFTESTSQVLLQGGVLADDRIAIGIPLHMAGTAVFCGAPDKNPAVHVFSGKNGFEFYSPAGLVMGGVVASREALRGRLSPQENAMIALNMERAHLAGARHEGIAGMRHFMKTVLNESAMTPQVLGNATLRQNLQERILSNLAQLLVECYPVNLPRMRITRRWKVIAQVREVVLSQPGTPITIEDICREVGMSRRTLQYCFQTTLGISPLEFLRAVRLNGVRRMLRTSASVTDAAAYWGFWHLSYFSRDYRLMFGELPSQTHRRYRGDVPDISLPKLDSGPNLAVQPSAASTRTTKR